MQLRYNPSNIVVAETLVKNNNVDMAALRRQLKMLVTEDPMAKEIEATETQKEEMMQLIVEQTKQIKKMEDEMGKMIKEIHKAIRDAVKGASKEAAKATIPLQAIPLTVIPAATTSTRAPGESTEQLAKAMENMYLQ